jgi:histidine phosphatase superfamily protein (branch 1)
MGRPHHRRLILVKHAEPVVEPDVPPNRWELSERGKDRCVALAERLRRYRPAAVVASEERKAAQTAGLVAERLGMAAATFPSLHEHDRTGAPSGPKRSSNWPPKGSSRTRASRCGAGKLRRRPGDVSRTPWTLSSPGTRQATWSWWRTARSSRCSSCGSRTSMRSGSGGGSVCRPSASSSCQVTSCAAVTDM